MIRSKYIFFTVASFLLVYNLVSCAKITNNNLSDNPSSAPYKDFLDIVVLMEQEKINKTDLNLYISNKTIDCVVFSNDYDTQIFAWVDNDWVEISNLVIFADDADVILSPAYDIYPDAVVSISPDYSNLSEQPQKVRVVFNATLCKNGMPSNKIVSDYIDIDLEK